MAVRLGHIKHYFSLTKQVSSVAVAVAVLLKKQTFEILGKEPAVLMEIFYGFLVLDNTMPSDRSKTACLAILSRLILYVPSVTYMMCRILCRSFILCNKANMIYSFKGFHYELPCQHSFKLQN